MPTSYVVAPTILTRDATEVLLSLPQNSIKISETLPPTTIKLTTPHARSNLPLNFMIGRSGRTLIQYLDSLLVQFHKIALEADITDPRLLIFTHLSRKVLLKEKGERAGGIEELAFDEDILYVRGLGEIKDLGSFCVGDVVEVEVVAVEEDF